MKKLPLAALFLLFILPAPARAEVQEYTLDKPHTQIVFIADHLGFSRSIGKFTDYSGGFTFDTENPAASHAEVTIETASIDLDDPLWNEHMRGENFFNAGKFPQMTFKSTKVEMTSDDTADMTGDLTLLGVTKPVTLHVTRNKIGPHPFGNKLYVAGFSARGALKRSDFEMTYGLPAVGDDIEIMIEVEAARTSPPYEGTNN